MKLTAKEKQLILEKRAQEEAGKPKKHGVLKHDLFCLDFREPRVDIDISDIIEQYGWFIPKNAVDEIRTRCLNEDDMIIAKKGTKFDCYIDGGEELWYDAEGIGIEEVDSKWAKIHLTIE